MVRVAFVSTYPPAQCGIGNYTRELVHAMRNSPDIDVSIIAERTAQPDTEQVLRAWDRRGDWIVDALDAVDAVRPDVVHVQHEESIFGNARCLPLFRALRERGIHSVSTLHTVHDRWYRAGFHRELARVCDGVIVHQRSGMASTLAAHGVPEQQLEVIPHGTPSFELPSSSEARAALDLPDGVPLAVCFGFIHYGKGLHVAIDAFERAQVGDARLVIAGCLRMSHTIDRVYASWLRRKLARGVADGRIVFRPGFVPAEHKPYYFAVADVIVLPHDQSYGSASGVLHEAIAARRPILCTRGKKFAEAIEAFGDTSPEIFPRAGDVRAWQRSFETLLLDDDKRARVRSLVASLHDETSWSVSAQKHATVYRGLARAPLSATAPTRARESAGRHVPFGPHAR